jgi:alanine dehydrogenase
MHFEDGGLESAIRCGIKSGVYFYHGILTNKVVGLICPNDINLIVF